MDATPVKVECEVDCSSFIDVKKEEESSSIPFLDVNSIGVNEKDDFNSTPSIDTNTVRYAYVCIPVKIVESNSTPLIERNVQKQDDFKSTYDNIHLKKEENNSSFPFIDVDVKEEDEFNGDSLIDRNVQKQDDFNSTFNNIHVKKEEDGSSFPFIDVNATDVKEESEFNDDSLVDMNIQREDDFNSTHNDIGKKEDESSSALMDVNDKKENDSHDTVSFYQIFYAVIYCYWLALTSV